MSASPPPTQDPQTQPPPPPPQTASSQVPETARVILSQDGGAEASQQIIAERNALRLQNDQLWKIIEKQKSVIHNLQKDNQKLAFERDRLFGKLREVDGLGRNGLPEEGGFSMVENRSSVASINT